jgi:hypothetical protein
VKNSAVLDKVRAFGMSNQMALADLSRISTEYMIDLRPNESSTSTAVDDEYYSQFTMAARAEAAEMAKHYQVFYCLERSIRDFVSSTIQGAGNEPGWWSTNRIPERIRNDVTARIGKEIDTGMSRRSDEEIDYTTFGELSQIITSNWDVFGGIFKSPRAVERVMGNLNSLRAPIAHCCLLGEDEKIRLTLSVRDWFRLME